MDNRKNAFWTVTDTDSLNLERYIRKQIKVSIEKKELMKLEPQVQKELSKIIKDQITSELVQSLSQGSWDLRFRLWTRTYSKITNASVSCLL